MLVRRPPRVAEAVSALDDEASRRLSLDVLAFRVLGARRKRLPLAGSPFAEARSAALAARTAEGTDRVGKFALDDFAIAGREGPISMTVQALDDPSGGDDPLRMRAR